MPFPISILKEIENSNKPFSPTNKAKIQTFYKYIKLVNPDNPLSNNLWNAPSSKVSRINVIPRSEDRQIRTVVGHEQCHKLLTLNTLIF